MDFVGGGSSIEGNALTNSTLLRVLTLQAKKQNPKTWSLYPSEERTPESVQVIPNLRPRPPLKSPVNNVIEPAGLRDGGVLPTGTELGWRLEVKVLRLHGWLAGRWGSVGSRGEAAQLSLLRPLWFGILVEAVEHDELVFLPVAGFGVSGALGWRGARGLKDAGILATAGLRGGVGLAVRFLRALWTNQTLPVQGCIGGLEVQGNLIL